MADVLFIHPTNHIHPRVLPVGSIAAANSIPHPVLGRYASEVTREEIRAAKVVLMDVHWFLPMGILGGLVGAIRRLNPQAKLVVGGLAASFYGEDFRARYDIDYVVGGHVETALPALIERLLAQETPPALPRVWGANQTPEPLRRPSQELFDSLDWITLDWFPTYARYAKGLHDGAHFDPAAPQMDAWPLLPLTRGCVRDCGFCYGAYQDRVFGAGVRARSPEALIRDLRLLEREPAVRFVSLLFADAVYVRRYLEPLDGQRFDLDAYLYFCGSLTPEELDRTRELFTGQVGFSIIQPADLSPLKRDDPPEDQEAEFDAMLQHIESLDDSGAVVFVIEEPSPALERAHLRPGNVLKTTGEDWPVVRPDEAALGEGRGLTQQLSEVEEHARLTSHVHLLRSLVPALAESFKMNDVFLYKPGALADRDLEALPKRVANLYMRGIFELRRYAIGEVELSWVRSEEAPRDGVDWSPPGLDPGTNVSWQHGLNGPVWSGELQVPEGGPWGVGIVPQMDVPDEEPIAVQGWTRASVPTLTVPPGPARTVRLGGGVREAGIDLWIEDGERRRDWLLETAQPESRDSRPDAVLALMEGLPGELSSLDEPEARDLVARLRANGWRVEDLRWSDRCVGFRATSPGAESSVALALFRAREPEPFLSQNGVGLVYGALPQEVTGARLADDVFAALVDRP